MRSTCVFDEIGIFPPCSVLVQLLHLPVVVLLERGLNWLDGEQQIAVSFTPILRYNLRRLCREQATFFERPDVFANGVRTQSNCFTDLPVTWPALERLAILAEQQVGIDCNFRGAQTQRENFFRQWEIVLD